jgi:hypothetical protein
VKVHVTFSATVASDRRARETLLESVLRAGRMTLANRARFERFGVITGEIEPERLDEVRAVPGVLAAEVDDATPLD